MISRRVTFLAGPLVAIAVAVGCAPHHPSQGVNESTLLGQDGTDANEMETQASSLTAAFTLGASGSADAGTTGGAPSATQVLTSAENTKSFFFPAGCLTLAKDVVKNEITYAFAGCSGVWGLSHVTGSVVAKFTTATTAAGGASLQMEVTGNDLTINRARASYHATATVTGSGLTRDMRWVGELSGTTARGRDFSRTAQWDVQWSVGQSCVRLNGTAAGNVTGREIDTTLTNYQRCRGECPQAGGEVQITDKATGRGVKIDFDGGTQAKFTGIDGRSYDIVLACGL